MIDRSRDMLEKASSSGVAIGAFSVYNLELARVVCAAAEQMGTPLLLQTGASAFRYCGEAPLRELAVAAALSSSAAVGVHLDHSRDIEEVETCLAAGYSSVMIDGSYLPFEENVELTRQAVKLAKPYGAWVEGELGGLGGDEDRSRGSKLSVLTDPAHAEEFVTETRVDALAVSIGNVHGIPQEPVELDFDRLAEIAARVTAPLVLHGASGLEPHDLRRCIELGVAKINVNTEVRRAYLQALRASLDLEPYGDDLPRLHESAIAAATAVVVEKQKLFSGFPTETIGR